MPDHQLVSSRVDSQLSVPVGVATRTKAAGVIRIVQVLQARDAALGTVLAFTTSAIALSAPGMEILRNVIKPGLIATFAGVVASGILLVGFVFIAVTQARGKLPYGFPRRTTKGATIMSFKSPILLALLAATVSMPLLVQAQPGYGRNWPGGGPGPYSPYGAAPYAAGNPYAQELNELAVKNPEKHDACFKEANEKNLRRDARWKFMIECMKK